jgi:hypothetical protein
MIYQNETGLDIRFGIALPDVTKRTLNSDIDALEPAEATCTIKEVDTTYLIQYHNMSKMMAPIPDQTSP